MDTAISIIVPTYKERDNITPLVERLAAALAGKSYEVVFVDDNSRDGTAEAVQALAERFPVKIIVRTNERGLASAVVEGIRRTSSPLVVVMDADLQHPPEVVPGLVKAIEGGADFAVGSRYVPGGGCQGWSLSRRIMSKGAIVLAHVFVGNTRKIKDATSGFFAFRRDLLAGAELKPIGYKIMLEVLIAARPKRPAEVPFVFVARTRGESKTNLGQQWQYLKHLWSLMRREGEIYRFLKFAAVGASGVIVNEGLLWLLQEFTTLALPVSSAIAIEASIITNYAFNNYYTFRDRNAGGSRAFMLRLGKFNAVSLVGLGINTGTLLLLTNNLGWYYLVANLIGIAIATLWNFFINRWWTWK